MMGRMFRGLVLTASVALTMAIAQQVPTATDFSACNLEAEVSAAVKASAVTHADIAPASVSPDRLLEGMRPDGQKDQAYREAYRTCMQGRGF